MKKQHFSFSAKLWKYDGKAAWYFVTLPKEVTKAIKDVGRKHVGWGTLRVEVKTVKDTWRTSLFPDSSIGYVLPIKKTVRKKLEATNGDTMKLELTIL